MADRATAEEIAEQAADEAIKCEVENTGLAYFTAALVIDKLRQAGYVLLQDDGRYCPRCGAPDDKGYPKDVLDG